MSMTVSALVKLKEAGTMDQDKVETLLPKSFKKVQEVVNRLLGNNTEEEKKDEDTLETKLELCVQEMLKKSVCCTTDKEKRFLLGTLGKRPFKTT